MIIIRVGDRFNSWVIIGSYITKPNRTRSWFCRCACGVEKYVDQGALIYSRSSSCGCAREVSEETRELLKQRSTGHTKSEETKAKISAANTGRKKPEGFTAWTPERIARQEQKKLLNSTTPTEE